MPSTHAIHPCINPSINPSIHPSIHAIQTTIPSIPSHPIPYPRSKLAIIPQDPVLFQGCFFQRFHTVLLRKFASETENAPKSIPMRSLAIQTDSGFTANSYGVNPVLWPNVQYYWHVQAANGCGTGPWSVTFTFTTDNTECNQLVATDVPITIPTAGPVTIISTIEVPFGGSINDVNVLNLIGCPENEA